MTPVRSISDHLTHWVVILSEAGCATGNGTSVNMCLPRFYIEARMNYAAHFVNWVCWLSTMRQCRGKAIQEELIFGAPLALSVLEVSNVSAFWPFFYIPLFRLRLFVHNFRFFLHYSNTNITFVLMLDLIHIPASLSKTLACTTAITKGP